MQCIVIFSVCPSENGATDLLYDEVFDLVFMSCTGEPGVDNVGVNGS